MNIAFTLLLCATIFISDVWTKDCAVLKSNTKLFCYYGDVKETNDYCRCSHVILPENTDSKIVEKIRKRNDDVKILITVREFNEKLVNLLKGTRIDGVELNPKKIDSKNDMSDFVSTVKSKLGTNLYVAISIPPKTEIIAKYFDFKELAKTSDVFVLNTAFLGASQNVTFHPSRLSGLWDMQNTDSMVDLVSGLGAPLSKLVITAPVQAYKFTLQNEEYTAPGSPAIEVKSINRDELCETMKKKGDEWTLERDQDQAGAYIFSKKDWIAFEDETSVDIKTKYARVRGLAGVALKDLSQDAETKCGTTLLEAAFKGLSRQARAPRGAVLHTLEREILSGDHENSGSVHASPFRITRVIDTEGKIHVIRQDTRTEFECSRQGYFVHPRSCNRFYRCVKFDQRTDEYNVFEFDCPAGLTFDEKTEVCVWPGSIPHSSACSGSSEIAPVPQKRFTCPSEPGYYADPENCRWFFACLDHGEASMQAYEFRCPFGLVFDEEKLLCEWSWLVPKCGLRLGTVTVDFYGGASTNINQYDGLGTLQTIKLGGLQGYIPVAESKTYSNVGRVETADKISGRNYIIGENSAQFIDASKRLGLSLKATQSLFNAGLLNSGLSSVEFSQGSLNLGALAKEVNSELRGAQYKLNIDNLKAEGSHIRDGSYYQNSNSDISKYGVDSLSSLAVNQGSSLDAIHGIQRVPGDNEKLVNTNLYHAGRNQQEQRELTGDSFYQYYQLGDQNLAVNGYSSIHSHQNEQNRFGNKLVASNLNLQNGAQENIQIIGNSVNGIPQVTPSSVSYTTASSFDSIVAATPLRTIDISHQKLGSNNAQFDKVHQASGFRFGDIKLDLKSDVNYQYEQNNQPRFVSSTLSPIDVHPVQINYKQSQILVKRPEVYSSSNVRPILHQTFVEPVSVLEHGTDIKPSIFSSGVKTSSESIYSQNTPKVFFKQQTPLVLQKSDGEQGISDGSGISIKDGYRYERPSISFEEEPQVIISSTPKSVTIPSSGTSYSYANKKINAYNYDKPSTAVNPEIFISSTPSTPTSNYYREDIHSGNAFVASPLTPVVKQEILLKPHVQIETGSQYIEKYQDVPGYNYDIPKIQLEERPQTIVEQSQTPIQQTANIVENYNYVKPVQQEVVVQAPAIPSQSYIKEDNIGYKYERPIVAFEEKPQIIVQKQPQVFVSSSPATSSYYRQDINSHPHKESQGFVVSPVTPLIQQKIVSTNTYVQPQLQVFKQKPVFAKVSPAVVTTYSKPVVQVESRSEILLTNPQAEVRPQKEVKDYSFVKQVVQPLVYVSSTQTPIVQKTVLKPSISQSFSFINQDTKAGYKYEKPLVVFEEKPEIETSVNYNFNNGYTEDKSSVVFEEKPKISILEQPIIAKIPQAVVKPPRVVETYNYFKPNIPPQVVVKQPQLYVSSTQTPLVQKTQFKPSISESFSFVNQHTNGGYKYEKPQVVFEEKPQTKSSHTKNYNFNTGYTDDKASVIFEEKPRISIIEQPTAAKISHAVVKPETIVESYRFVKPDITPQVVVQQPQVYVSTTQTPLIQKIPSTPQTFTYSNRKTNYGYKYEKPNVVFEERPQIDLELNRPLVESYTVNTGYKYEKPSVTFEEKPQVLVKQDIAQPTVSYNKIFLQQKIPSYQYEPTPIVQQPRGFTKQDFQEAAIEKYSYSNPVHPQYIVKPATILSTTYRTPVAVKTQSIDFKGYGYPRPRVQFVEEPNVVITNYENKIPVVETPIVPKKAYVTGNSYRYQNKVHVEKQLEPIEYYTTPKPTFVSTVASIVAQRKPIDVSTQDFVYYDSRLDNPKIQTNYLYPEPQIRFYERPRQKLIPIVKESQQKVIDYTYSTPRPTYLSTVRSVIKQKVQPLQQNFVYYDSRLSTTPSAQIQYLESTTVKPIATVTTSYLPSVVQKLEKVENIGQVYSKPTVNIYQYNEETVSIQKQLNTPKYVAPEAPFSYQTSPKPTISAVVYPQKLEKVDKEFTYYDSRFTTQIPNIRFVETSTPSVSIVSNNQKVEFEGYNYPKPQIKFEEEKFVVPSYGNKEPVREEPIVPKKAYITTGSSYIENQNIDVDVKPIVREDYRVENYQEYSNRPKLEKLYFSTPKPTYTSTISATLSKKFTPIKQDFVYYDSRFSSTSKPQAEYSERPRIPTRITVTSPVVQKLKYVESNFNQNLKYLEQPEQVITEQKVDQPSIIESYVSPNYQKYETSLPSSTITSILEENIQPIKQEVRYYDSILSTPRPDIKKVPNVPQVIIQPKVKITTASPVLVQKLEQEVPIEPFYYYDSKLSSTQTPNVEILNEEKIQPQFVEQKITNSENIYSSSERTISDSEIEYRPRVKIVKQKKLFIPSDENVKPFIRYRTSTPRSDVVYAEIETKEPSSTYLPIRKRIKSTTKPSREYLPTKTTYKLSNEYLPSSTTTVSNEYLPISSSESPAIDGISVENYQNFELVRKKSRPVKVVKIVRPRVKTVVIKKNDFNPFLSAKLGAQCTCTSNTLELRKEQLKIEVPDYDDEEDKSDDDDAILVAKNDGVAIVVENYEASDKDVSVTPEEDIDVRSSTVEIPISTYRVKKVNRGRTRAQNVLIEGVASRKSGRVDIEASEVTISASRVKVKTPRVDIKVDEGSEVNVKGKTGSKYVEIEENDVEVSNDKTGILPGIDCQRAGLFRHPTQCNKFYSCRWDCKKNKFTLHVFNCPVHLTFDNNLGACNWPSQGPACLENTLLPSE